ncbi:retrovirus-related pol polyprotein from transposon TNT 1-94, partial [Tanacetum coccineum]
MLNRNYKTSFAKPEFLKKAQRVNPRLYDIGIFVPKFRRINADYGKISLEVLKRKWLADWRYFNSLEHEVDSLNSQLDTQKTQFLNKIDRLSREYYYVDHMNAILGVYTEMDEVTNLQCDYLEALKKCERLEKELSKSRTMSKSFEALQKHAINLELALQQWVIPTTSVSRPQLKSNQLEDRAMPNNSQGKKKEVEDHRTVKFGNDQIAPRIGYGDPVQGNITIKRVYYVKGLNHNLFFVGQFCDADLEVDFRKSTCYVRDLKGNDLLICSCGSDLYSITLQDTTSPNTFFLMAKATSSQAWLWHRRLSHLNFDSINLLSKNDIVIGLPNLKFIKDHLCSSCDLGKAEQKSFHTKTTLSSKRRYTWTRFLRSKDETSEVLINFLRLVQRGLHAQVAQTTLSAAKVPLFFWAEAIAIAYFTQNHPLVIPLREKNPYHIINGRKPYVKFFHIFGSLCYIVRDGENLDKMKEKGDACIFVWYSTQSRAYRVYNKRTRVIIETIHVNFDELPQMASDHVNSDLVPQCPTTTFKHASLIPGPQSQENVPYSAETVTTSIELDLLFSPMFGELLNGTTLVVSKSSDVTATDAPNQHQQQNTTPFTSTTVAADIPPLNIQTTPKTTNQAPTQAPTVTAIENINQAKIDKENT